MTEPASTVPAAIILPLDAADASLELVGGKGRSLAKLAAAGLPVPAGFLISTRAYRDFVAEHELQGSILESAAAADDVGSFEQASAHISSLFQAEPIPPALSSQITHAYAGLGEHDPPVAVRSSATAEDLPEFSFAGQQDSFLNVRGEATLLDAIRRCWASLWSARAISYRRQMNIDQQAMAMGVVVQVMVDADVSGILFTANPADGERSELVVNASFGLGEAIVGGLVTPDTYILDRNTLELKQSLPGAKAEMIVAASEQGTTTQLVPEAQRAELSLPAFELGELAALSLQAEALFGGQPQDIEWAVADGRCWLLQSRPITNLPAPALRDAAWDPPSATAKLVRRQVVENMPEPLSPLFEELYLNEGLDQALDRMMANMGLPFHINEFVALPLFVTVNGYGYCRYDFQVSWRIVRRIPQILYWYVTKMPALMRSLVPNWRDEGLPTYLATIEQYQSLDLAAASDEQLLAAVRSLSAADANYWFYVTMVVGAAKITEGLLNRLVTSRLVPGDLTSGMFLSGFPSKTLEAQENLEAIALQIQAAESVRELVATCPAQELIDTLQNHLLGNSIAQSLHQHLERYGHQVYDLDFAQPTQAEEPLPVFLSLQALLQDTATTTAARRVEIARARDELVQKTLAKLGPIRRWLLRKLLAWAQNYGPYREEALFYMGAAWPTLRRLAAELGHRLVAVGTLTSTEAVFYLESTEIADACIARNEQRACPDLAHAAQQRMELREARKRLHPPARVPEDLRFKFGPFDFTNVFAMWETQKLNADDSATLNGFAVSPGKVTGLASVILSPSDFADMKPNSILVCPTTTPAWTPLFAQASGLVTDIGAILAHGSIVAREYGIPAVLGTGNVTQRIVSGQRITVDGDAGTVTIVD